LSEHDQTRDHELQIALLHFVCLSFPQQRLTAVG